MIHIHIGREKPQVYEEDKQKRKGRKTDELQRKQISPTSLNKRNKL